MKTDNPIQSFSIEAEQSVIGALLTHNDAFDRIEKLEVDHFYRHDHRLIFGAIQKLVAQNKSADVITVFQALQNNAKADECGGVVYLNEMQQNTPTSANIVHYANIVRDKAIRRKLLTFSAELGATASTGLEETETILQNATTALDNIAQTKEEREPRHVSEGMIAFVEDLDERYQGRGKKPTSTGFADIDKRLNGGVRGGDLIILAGRPSMGKTALALNIGNNVALDYNPVLVCSMEMPESQLHDRNVASIGKIPLQHIIDAPTMADEDWQRLTYAVQKMSDIPLFLDDEGGLTLQRVRAKAKKVHRKHGLKVLILDYLQLMNGSGGKSDTRNNEIEVITRGLKALAKELDVAIILLSQLNRDLEKRPNKRPMMADLRDSGAIEQDADIIMFIYRDEVYNPDSPDRGVAELNFAKVRQGALGTISLTYFGEQVRFENNLGWSQRMAQTQTQRKQGKGLADAL